LAMKKKLYPPSSEAGNFFTSSRYHAHFISNEFFDICFVVPIL
jgi:hypothetical protein